MELTYQSQIRLPASFTALSVEEMTYVEGGAVISQEQVLIFALNVVVNGTLMLGQSALTSAMNSMQEMHDDGMSIYGSVRYFWDGQNTRGKVSVVVVGALAGVYGYIKVRQTINTVVSLYQEIKAIYQQSKADQAAEEAAAAAIPAAPLAA